MTRRFVKHLRCTTRVRNQIFPSYVLHQVAQAVSTSETEHTGELIVVIERSLSLRDLILGKTAHNRAIELFTTLHIWDTPLNNGVLLYLLLADRDIEIVADRGAAACIPAAEWQEICSAMEERFRNGDFANGLQQGISAITKKLAAHFPPQADTHDFNRFEDLVLCL